MHTLHKVSIRKSFPRAVQGRGEPESKPGSNDAGTLLDLEGLDLEDLCREKMKQKKTFLKATC